MKEFFKDKTFEDYLLMGLLAIIILGGILFVVGYFWGFSTPLGNTIWSGKTSIKEIVEGKSNYYNAAYGSKVNDGINLFSLMGIVDPSWGAAYGMCITAIIGVSLLLLSVAIIIIIMIVGLIVDVIIPKMKK